MKALSFREVMASIKEGEEYVNTKETYAVKGVYMSSGNIVVYTEKDFNRFVVDDRMRFKKVMEEYTFQEAFKAFEKGKEIESCLSGFKFKIYEDTVRIKGGCYKALYECLKVKVFSIEEILGGWYIHD